mmetsp:Transcript_66240/g.158446  ORF Transcript_66240/g.158446 Transcript_66240/m.158446 type:complete len:622 (-) Transcript_66240:3-1868(-)
MWLQTLPSSQKRLLAVLVALLISAKVHKKVAAWVQQLFTAASLQIVQILRPVKKDFLAGHASAGSPVQNLHELSGALPHWLQNSLEREGFETLKPIQKAVLPLALAGKDVVAIAPTGSGKTLAFLVPGFVHAQGQSRPVRLADGPLVLILSPTRELATQIGGVAGRLSGHLRTSCIYGGVRRIDQLHRLRSQRSVDVMIATPGRLIDFVMNFGAFRLRKVSFFVLDEGDRMLEEGFEEDVLAISAEIRKDRQMLFFSATWPAYVEATADRLCCRGATPVKVTVESPEVQKVNSHDAVAYGLPAGLSLPPPEIEQIIEVLRPPCDFNRKVDILLEHLEEPLCGDFGGRGCGKVLIFVGTRRLAEDLGMFLTQHFGLDRCGLAHGGRSQEQREAALNAFRSGSVSALVSTDVLGRGVDIPNVTHVVIFDFPGDIETYVHRVGRTGRNGCVGRAISFFEPHSWQQDLARELVAVLRACRQQVPPDLEPSALKASEPQEALPELDENSPPLASDLELGEWAKSGVREWRYSANAGKSWQRVEFRARGKLRTSWGWGEWWHVKSRTPAGRLLYCDSQAPPDMALSWDGIIDVVALGPEGRDFKLISRNGRPARPDKVTTLGKACLE